MRLIFVLCMVLCSVAVTAPATTDPDLVVTVSDTLDDHGEANPVDLVVSAATPTPTATPTPVKATAEPTAAPTPTRQPSPQPTPSPAPTATPRASPTPTPMPRSVASDPRSSYSREESKDGIRQAWGGDDDKAIGVADCESGLNPRATSPDGRHLGLWQVRAETWETYGGSGDPRDASPEAQTNIAWRLYQQRGWSPWAGCA